MSLKISAEAQTALEWAFGAYADTDPGIPFDIILSVDLGSSEPQEEQIDAMARKLVQTAILDGIGGRICLGWCTFIKDDRFGLGVMAFQKTATMLKERAA